MLHRKPPMQLRGKHRITCPHCLQIIEDIKRYLKPPNATGRSAACCAATNSKW
jgi:hypothetical protein